MWIEVDGKIRHRPWWKVAINTVLRAVQTKRRPAKIWVIATRCACTHPGEPHRVIGYTLAKVEHLS